jgi:antitoxin (DNA-binding transcriptional repressor) of toxin-antitoxin stability system
MVIAESPGCRGQRAAAPPTPGEGRWIDRVIFMTQYSVMIKANIHAVKTHLSRYLARVAAGDTVVICNRNVPVAEIRPVAARRTTRRPVGLARGRFEVPPAFFEPLAEADLDRWEGRAG